MCELSGLCMCVLHVTDVCIQNISEKQVVNNENDFLSKNQLHGNVAFVLTSVCVSV